MKSKFKLTDSFFASPEKLRSSKIFSFLSLSSSHMFMKINRITCHRPTTTTTVIPQTYSVGAYVEYTMSVSITGVSSIVIRFTKATSSSVTGKTTWTTTSSSSADYLFTDSSRYPQLHLVDGYSDCSKLPTSGSYSSFQLKEYKSTCEYPCKLYRAVLEMRIFHRNERYRISAILRHRRRLF